MNRLIMIILLSICVMPRIWEPVEKATINWVKPSGWMLSGYAKTGIDNNLNRWRVKIGIISEMDALSKYDRDIDRDIKTLHDWDIHRGRGTTFGIFFVKEF